METTIELDASNRIVLTKSLRQAAGITPQQKLKVISTPGRIVLETEAETTGKILRRGKLKIWTGEVPATPIQESVEQARYYSR